MHKDKSYPGEHEAIVDEALWSEAQEILTKNRADHMLGMAEKQVSLLSGILFDARGERMSPTHTTKNDIRYRYYISQSLLTGTEKHSGQRIPASSLGGPCHWPASIIGWTIEQRCSISSRTIRPMLQPRSD